MAAEHIAAGSRNDHRAHGNRAYHKSAAHQRRGLPSQTDTAWADGLCVQSGSARNQTPAIALLLLARPWDQCAQNSSGDQCSRNAGFGAYTKWAQQSTHLYCESRPLIGRFHTDSRPPSNLPNGGCQSTCADEAGPRIGCGKSMLRHIWHRLRRASSW